MFGSKNYYGVYGEDFLTFGEFSKDAKYPIDHEETLLKIFDDENEVVVDKHTFKFDGNKVVYGRQVNEEIKDCEVEHSIEPTQLTP